MADSSNGWSVEQSNETYHVRGWGEPYFRVNDKGRVEVRPNAQALNGVDLYELVEDLQARGVSLPLLIRFADIVDDRVRQLNECFKKAIDEYGYGGRYQGVYPVKVNPQKHLVEEIVRIGAQYDFGLEAGSKPELLIALSAMEDSDGLIICNGYKDEKFIETALIAGQFDKTIIIVLERIEELDLVFKVSERLGIRPIVGVRARLSAKGIGKWAESGGDHAKFGLNMAEIVEVVDRLAAKDMVDCLKLLHFHIGSQVSSIIPLKNALREATQIYVELKKMGAAMGYIDCGGGLAVDYDGSKTDFHASKNYDTQEYAYDIVNALQEACRKASVPEPTIVTESGRSIASYQSVLVFDVLGSNETRYPEPEPPPADAHSVVKNLYDTWKNIKPKNVQESWHDAQQAKEEAISLFKFGYLSLRDRGHTERLVWHCGAKIMHELSRLNFVPEELQELEKLMSLVYYCNFSVFQSAPDTWAIDQLFPIMPIHRLDEKPTIRARLADLTCDSDGVIDHFIDVDNVKQVLDVHSIKPDQQYVLGMFLLGAYQEILGDLHNLFGDTNAVHVRLTEHGYDVSHVIRGDTMTEVLRYVQYDPEAMSERLRRQAETALKNGRVTLKHLKLLQDNFEESLRSSTYLSNGE